MSMALPKKKREWGYLVNALILYIPCECRHLDDGYSFFYHFRHSINKKMSMALPRKIKKEKEKRKGDT